MKPNDERRSAFSQSSPPTFDAELELRASFWQHFFNLITGGIILMCPGLLVWQLGIPAGRTFWSEALLLLVLSVFIYWGLWGRLRETWSESRLRLRVNRAEIVVNTANGDYRGQWKEIEACTTESHNRKGEDGWWITLWDRDQQILIQWDRNWACFSGNSTKRADEIEAFIHAHLKELGRKSEQGGEFAEIWRQMNPVVTAGEEISVKTGFGAVGRALLLMAVPCAGFAFYYLQEIWIVVSLIGIFLFLGIYCLLRQTTLRADEAGVETCSRLALHRIKWSEIKAIKMDIVGFSLVFEGDEKRLATYGPLHWQGGEFNKFYWFVRAQADMLKIPFDDKAPRAIKFSKNTQVKRDTTKR